jgi:hypothetical protein
MSDPNQNLGPPLGGPSLEDDEKALKKGNTWVLVAAVVGGLAVVAGLIALLASEQPDQYGTIGSQINGMKAEHFDAFWACALPNEPLDELRSDQDLRYAINRRAQTAPGRYAQHVRHDCLVKLNEHEAPLQSLIAPADLSGQLAELGTSLESLRGAWGEYLEYLDHTQEYDQDDAAPRVGKIAKGWYDYKRAHGALNAAIREHLNE